MVSASTSVYRSDEPQRLAVEVARHVEPCPVVVVRDVHDQRVAFPAAARVAHPEIDACRSGLAAVRVDQAIDLGPLEGHRDVIARLEDVEREAPCT